jgi:4'-phosphopantetheinyl transferase
MIRDESGPIELEADQVHIWQIDLVASEAELAFCRALLSREELGNVARFRFTADANACAVVRASLRIILSWYFGCDPRELEFTSDAWGKPELLAQPALPRLHRHGMPEGRCRNIRFNYSHSGNAAVFAISRGREVGIDIEKLDECFDLAAVASIFLAPSEREALMSLPPKCRAPMFFSCWTRKEAYAKAIGQGVRLDFSTVDLPFASTAIVRRDNKEWTVLTLVPPPGYSAAVAVEGGGVSLKPRHMHVSIAGEP